LGVKVCFLLGSPDISGGTNVIFNHAAYMVRQGWDVTIVSEAEVTPERTAWHPEAKVLRFAHYRDVAASTFDIAVATWWPTTYNLHHVSARHYAYFIQSIESRFPGSREEALRDHAENTYLFDIHFITEVDWIKDYLSEHYGRECHLAYNGIDKSIYCPEGPVIMERHPARPRVLIEGSLNVPLKNTERTIQLCNYAGAQEIWLMTPTRVDNVDGVDRLFSCISQAETAKVYRSCDILVKLSYVEGMFGPPLEMLHCGGTAVCYQVTGHDLYLEHEKNALLIEIDDEIGAVAAIQRLLLDSDLRTHLCNAGRRTADAWPDWTQSSTKFCQIIKDIQMKPNRGATRQQLRGMAKQLQMAYKTTEKLQNNLAEIGVEPTAMNPSTLYPLPTGRIIAELEADICKLKSQIVQLKKNGTSARERALERQIEELRKANCEQETLVLQRWNIMQEMGQTIFDRDQRIAFLEAKLRDSNV
jgi:O-antigen biosynthesis protein